MRDIRFFMEWLKAKEFDKSVVLEYKRELIEKYAPASVNSMLSSFITRTGKPLDKCRVGNY